MYIYLIGTVLGCTYDYQPHVTDEKNGGDLSKVTQLHREQGSEIRQSDFRICVLRGCVITYHKLYTKCCLVLPFSQRFHPFLVLILYQWYLS